MCRLGVLHDICEALPEKCGPQKDQIAVTGGLLEIKHIPAETPKSYARLLHNFYRRYTSNSEAKSFAWVLKRTCTELKGGALLLATIQHVDLGAAPEEGDNSCPVNAMEEIDEDLDESYEQCE
jgi:hypothetical protein